MGSKKEEERNFKKKGDSKSRKKVRGERKGRERKEIRENIN